MTDKDKFEKRAKEILSDDHWQEALKRTDPDSDTQLYDALQEVKKLDRQAQNNSSDSGLFLRIRDWIRRD